VFHDGNVCANGLGDVITMSELQRAYARWALERHKTRTAERLDIDAKTLNRWLADDRDL